MTTPSASPAALSRLWVRMAWEMTGVGVNPRPFCTRSSIPLAAKTSTAEPKAGSERAWVSMPMKRGPTKPLLFLCSATAWLTARMWASLKDPFREEPRWPEVPKETRWAGSSGSGRISR